MYWISKMDMNAFEIQYSIQSKMDMNAFEIQYSIQSPSTKEYQRNHLVHCLLSTG